MTIRFDNVSYTYQKGTPYQHQAIHDVNTEFEQVNITPSLDKRVVVNQR